MVEQKPLRTGEIARLLHVTRVTVFTWIRSGKLKAYRVPGGHYQVTRAEFRQFLADNRIPISLDPPPGRRILVVDDDPAVREAFEAALTAEGHQVVLVEDGREALRILGRERFDLIFLDILLPGMSGAALMRDIRRRDPRACVVLVTGFPDHDKALAALEYGPAMLLRKPVRLPDIRTALDIALKA